jgi:bifunctional DNA-binding transcriptional regulator/antitoxin component of YhaV-PrlF toxin-antitoxin module
MILPGRLDSEYVTIDPPKTVGEKLGTSPGDVVGFYEEDGKIMIQKMK